MDYKIILSDIDGTLLTSDHRVLPRTAAAIRQVVARGIPFALVSARMPEAITPIIAQIGTDAAKVCYNGALVITPEGMEIHDERMSRAHTDTVLNLIAQSYSAASMSYYAGHTWYVRTRDDADVQREEGITGVHSVEENFQRLIAADILPNKLFSMGTPELIVRMEQELSEVLPTLSIVRSAPHLLEIIERTVSKATGIEILLAHYGIDRSEALAFGDNYNDIPMLRYVGHSVAMGNAPDAIKDIADSVTEANDADGIYHFLKKIHMVE